MTNIDVLIITALKQEYEAARHIALASEVNPYGVRKWEENIDKPETPYLLGEYVTNDFTFNVALARPTRMGSTSTSPLASSLVTKLNPYCLAMCGVCAGNPSDVVLGDVIIAEIAYAYDEGKQKPDEFEGDHRQSSLDENWFRTAQDLTSDGLMSVGPVSEEASTTWVLEQLYQNINPRIHHANSRYFPNNTWAVHIKKMLHDGLVEREGANLKLTDLGRDKIEENILFNIGSPDKLPFQIKVGPMASGNVVVKDGITWDKLKGLGVRTALGLEMEAATIGTIAKKLKVPQWIVIKGVMDYADPKKNDRIKSFSAKASAEVLFKFLQLQLKKDNVGIKNVADKINSNRNIFKPSGTLPPNHESYIERKSDEQLKENINSNNPLTNIIGESGIGKSSLLNQVESYLPSEKKFCYIDLTKHRLEDPKLCIDGFFKEIKKALNEEINSWDDIKEFSKKDSILLLIDEFGVVADYQDATKGFVKQLIGLTFDSNVSIVTAISDHCVNIEDFINSLKLNNSKYSTNWVTIKIGIFNDIEMKNLIRLLHSDISSIVENHFDLVKAKTRNHPRPLQCLCRKLTENYIRQNNCNGLIDIINQDSSYR